MFDSADLPRNIVGAYRKLDRAHIVTKGAKHAMKFARGFPPTSPVSELRVELDGEAVVVALVPRGADSHAASHDFPLAREPAFRAAIVRWLAGQASWTHFDPATVESIANQIVDEFDNLLPEE